MVEERAVTFAFHDFFEAWGSIALDKTFGRDEIAWAMWKEDSPWILKHHIFEEKSCKHVRVKLRLKLFDAVVSPTALYGLDTTPLNGC